MSDVHAVVVVHSGIRGNLDPTSCAVATGVVAAYSDAGRLTGDGLSQLAWLVTDVGDEMANLLVDLRSVFRGEATVTCVTFAPLSCP